MSYKTTASFDTATALIDANGKQTTIRVPLPDSGRLRGSVMWRDAARNKSGIRRLASGAGQDFEVIPAARKVVVKANIPQFGTTQQLMIHDGRGYIMRTGFVDFPPTGSESLVLYDTAVDLNLHQIAQDIIAQGVDADDLPNRLSGLTLHKVTLTPKSAGIIGAEISLTAKLKRRGSLRARLLFDIRLLSAIIYSSEPRGVNLVQVSVENMRVRGGLARIINGLSLNILSTRIQSTLRDVFYERINGMLDDILAAYKKNGGTAQSMMDLPLVYHRCEPGPNKALRMHFNLVWSIGGHIQNVQLDALEAALKELGEG